MDSQPLTGGRTTQGVVRVGDTVRRPFVGERTLQRECLLHLERVGFAGVPRFLGIDEAGREILSFLPGHVPDDLGFYTDAQIGAAAALLRQFHDATAGMEIVRSLGMEVACHNDWAPTNAVFEGDLPTGLIDFDTMRPGLRLWDLGYSAFTWLDLGDDEHTSSEQLRRLSIFAAAYDFPGCTAAQIAIFALARQEALAASTQAHGQVKIARWAMKAARWTALNVVEPLSPTGYPQL